MSNKQATLKDFSESGYCEVCYDTGRINSISNLCKDHRLVLSKCYQIYVNMGVTSIPKHYCSDKTAPRHKTRSHNNKFTNLGFTTDEIENLFGDWNNFIKYINQYNRARKPLEHWDEMRLRCVERDDGMCRICRCEENLEVHHITPRKQFPENSKDVHELSNLITLCISCHNKYEGQFVGKDPKTFVELASEND